MDPIPDRSPLHNFLAALDRLDLDGAVAFLAVDCHILMVDGQQSEGREGIRALVQQLFGSLRSMTHTITSEWHEGNMWIAEVDATYERHDWLRLEHLPRAFFVVESGTGISDIRVYGANEQPLTALGHDHDSARVGGRWWLPL